MVRTVCKTPAEFGPQYISTPPSPHSHALSEYTVHWEGVGVGQREGTVEGQQFTSWVENTNYYIHLTAEYKLPILSLQRLNNHYLIHIQ
jgi:hypothetical protein